MSKSHTRMRSVSVKMPAADIASLKARATKLGLSPSEYLRQACTGASVTVIRVDPIAGDQYRDLARLSGNINQVAKHINSGGLLNPDDTQATFEDLRHLLSHIRQYLSGVKLLNGTDENPF
jgi:hypothetical protein